MNEDKSESGDPIYRHEPREKDWVPPDMSDNSLEAISDHIEMHIGKVTQVWHEILSDLVHVDVHEVAPTEDRPYWTLVTSGMSDKRMAAPEGSEEWAFAELMLCLPKDWKMKKEDWTDERYYWPIRWLKILARFPHEYETWLSWGHSIPTGDPATPVHESVGFDGFMLLRPKTVSSEFWTLRIREDKLVHFFAVIPVYPGEMALKLKAGAETLDQRFDREKVSEIIDPQRKDVSKRGRWW